MGIFVELARSPWQFAQFWVYKAAPSRIDVEALNIRFSTIKVPLLMVSEPEDIIVAAGFIV